MQEPISNLELEQSILPWIGKTGKLLFVFITEKFRQHGFDMSMEQMIVLKILHEQDGRPQNDMAIVTNRHKATLARLIDNMEKKNLVARIPDQEDKRVNRVFLTTQGRKFFRSAIPIIHEATEELQAGITPEEITTLIQILKKVQTNMGLSVLEEKNVKPCD